MKTKISTRQRLSILFILLVHYVLTLATLICTFVIHRLSAHYDPGYLTTRYDRGTFDPETWACEMPLSHNLWGRDGAILHRQCSFEKSSRWVSVCIFVLSAIFGAVMVYVLSAEKEVVAQSEKERWEGDNDYEYDSPSVYSR